MGPGAGPEPAGLVDSWLLERDAELGEIDDALVGAQAGEGWVVILDGPAGIGKTALLGAARERGERAGIVVLSARGTEFEGDFPYGLARQLLEATVRGADPARQQRLLGGAAALARPAVLGESVAPEAGADPAFAVMHGLYWLVANLASEAPLALLVDDVHWADAPSLRFFGYLARRLDGLAMTVIASVRSGETGSDLALVDELRAGPGARSVTPAALSEAAVASVLSADFGRSADPEFVRSCRQVTGGNPFYVRELAATLRADGIEPTVAATRQIAAAAPLTIARATLVRLGRLSDEAADLARAIAVLGADASMPRCAAVAGLDEQRALLALDALTAVQVIPDGGDLEFRHPIVRAAIYDAIGPGARSAGHHHAASLLAAEGADLDAVAGHLLQSQPLAEPATIATLRDAASHALALGAPDNAATYLSRALEEGCERELRATILLELGLAERSSGRPRAVERFEEVQHLSEDPTMRARAMIEQAWIAWYGGDWLQMVQLLDGALAMLGDEDPLRIRAEEFRAGAAMYDPRLIRGFVDGLPILEQLVASRRPATRPLALLLASWGAQRDGSPDQIRALVEFGWDEGCYIDDGETVEILPQGLLALALIGEFDQAAAIVDRLRAAARKRGSAIQYLFASAHDAWFECLRGNLAAAATEMRSCIERAVALNLQFAVLSLLWYCAEVLVERPDTADLAALAEGIELGPLADTLSGALLIATRGRLRFVAGDTLAAIADLRHVGAVHDALGVTNSMGFSSWRLALALMLDRSQRDEALMLTQTELTLARRSGQPRRLGAALRTLGTLEPDWAAGEAHLAEAVTLLAGTPMRLEHARALVEFGAARRRNRERAAARGPLRDGLDLATRCGAVRLADRARSELAATGARPRSPYATGREALTASELRVALMAAKGRTSQEIAQALFVTTKTVDGHLNHTYIKLGINSRKQLASELVTTKDR